MKKNQLVMALVVLAALGALLVYAQHKHPIQWDQVLEQFRQADWSKIGIALGCIYVSYALRSMRWALLLKHTKRVPLFSLLSTQVIGFTAVALIGRVADPVRPFLVSKKTGLPLSAQVAVYIVDRLFDAGSMALIFSSVILFTAWFGVAGALPHAEILKKAGYWGLALTAAGGVFLVTVRLAGGLVASLFERTLGLLSKNLGHAMGNKIRSFRAGLDTMRSLADFGAIAGLSLAMWLLISFGYLEVMRAFVASPQLGSMNLGKSMLLLATSGLASVIQLPVVGWFTQILIVAGAMTGYYGATLEASTACATMLLLITFLGIVPVGLIWARFEHVSLRKVAAESEHAEVELAVD